MVRSDSPRSRRARATVGPRARFHRIPVGWRIFSILAALAVSLYFQQRTLSVAAERIMPELSLSQMQIGWLMWASLLGYTCFQFPGGILGQQLGGHRTLFITALIAALGGIILPLAPNFMSGAGLFIVLLAAQLLVGIVQAPMFPVSSGVMQGWLPANRWAIAQGIQTMASQLGAALTPPVIVLLMQRLDWQRALLLPVLPEVALVVLWAWYARDDPSRHSSTTVEELNGLQAATGSSVGRRLEKAEFLRIVSNKSILLLTISYLSMNYVFYLLSNWSFLYLIQERHFTVLEAGWLASLPPLGAAVGAGLGGGICDALCGRFGVVWGYRLVPLFALPLAGALLLIATLSTHAFVAVTSLVLCFASVELTEGPFWAATMWIAQSESSAATGILNTGGNFGGIIGIPIVAYLSSHREWNLAFALGLFFAIAATVAWLGVDVRADRVSAPV